MTKSVYVKSTDGAVIWLDYIEPKVNKDLEARLKLLFRDIKDEDLDEVD